LSQGYFFMKKYTLSILVVLVALLAIGGWLWYGETKQKPTQSVPVKTEVNNTDSAKTDQISDEVIKTCNDQQGSWLIKEAEMFSIKFPKDWCWVELKQNPQDQALIYKSNFDLSKDPYVGLDGEGMTIENKDEVIVSFYGWPTEQALGLPDSEISKLSEKDIIQKALTIHGQELPKEYNAKCTQQTSGNQNQSILMCSYSNSGQDVRKYFIANIKTTISLTVHRSAGNTLDTTVFDGIAKSIVLKNF